MMGTHNTYIIGRDEHIPRHQRADAVDYEQNVDQLQSADGREDKKDDHCGGLLVDKLLVTKLLR